MIEKLLEKQLQTGGAKQDSSPWEQVAKILGHKGSLNADGSYKVSLLRTDVTINGRYGFAIPPGMGLNSYAAFSGTGADSVVVGDTCMLAHEVNPIIDALRKGGVEVVAIHNHMLRDDPRLFFLHFQGQGSSADLARTVRKAWDEIGRPKPDEHDVTAQAPPTLDTAAISRILRRTGKQSADGTFKVSLPRASLSVKLDSYPLRPGVGLGCWVAFYACPCGRTMAMGDTCVTRDELQPALDALRKGGVEITAIHNHLLGERTEVMFMHFEAEGEALDIARTIRSTWDTLGEK